MAASCDDAVFGRGHSTGDGTTGTFGGNGSTRGTGFAFSVKKEIELHTVVQNCI